MDDMRSLLYPASYRLHRELPELRSQASDGWGRNGRPGTAVWAPGEGAGAERDRRGLVLQPLSDCELLPGAMRDLAWTLDPHTSSMGAPMDNMWLFDLPT